MTHIGFKYILLLCNPPPFHSFQQRSFSFSFIYFLFSFLLTHTAALTCSFPCSLGSQQDWKYKDLQREGHMAHPCIPRSFNLFCSFTFLPSFILFPAVTLEHSFPEVQVVNEDESKRTYRKNDRGQSMYSSSSQPLLLLHLSSLFYFITCCHLISKLPRGSGSQRGWE